jgi:tRNA pseudouridine38-40 synthase
VTLFDPAESPVSLRGPTARVRLTVAYDGAGFHGFAINEGVRTVGGTLANAITRVVGQPVRLTCAGRTDTGVHAVGQVVTFDAPADGLDLAHLQRGINRLCAPSIAVRDGAIADPDFDARLSATGRRYRYLILNRDVPDPFLASRSWHVEQPLNLFGLSLGCDALLGEHDFSSFCRRPKHNDGREASLVRRVVDAGWTDDGDGVLRFEIEASSFCHQMVRSVVGTLVAMGAGRRRPGEMAAIVRSKDRRYASDLAPAHGLTLMAVRY